MHQPGGIALSLESTPRAESRGLRGSQGLQPSAAGLRLKVFSGRGGYLCKDSQARRDPPEREVRQPPEDPP